jgi:hypothetical protein
VVVVFCHRLKQDQGIETEAMAVYHTAYVEMNCIGDHADFVVYYDESNAERKRSPNECRWMVPGSWEGRDQFGRKQK